MEIAGWWLLCVVVWSAGLTVVTPAEVVVAAVVAVPCAVVARLARRQVARGWRIRLAWFAGCWRLPVTAVADTVRVWRAAARRECGRTRVVRVGADDAHRAVAVAVRSASPGQVVVDDGDDVRVHIFGDDP
jgi:multisubunit Na+/H+ antiporter MnhE subunit